MLQCHCENLTHSCSLPLLLIVCTRLQSVTPDSPSLLCYLNSTLLSYPVSSLMFSQLCLPQCLPPACSVNLWSCLVIPALFLQIFITMITLGNKETVTLSTSVFESLLHLGTSSDSDILSIDFVFQIQLFINKPY